MTKRLGLSIVIGIVVAVSAAAGETAGLPKGMLAYASVGSFDAALEKLDAFLAACTRDVPAESRYEPGALAARLAQSELPLPEGMWDRRGWFRIALVNTSSGIPAVVFVVKAAGMEKVRQALLDGGATVENSGGGLRVIFNGPKRPIFLVGLGDEYIVGSDSKEGAAIVVRALSGWSPERGNADALLVVDMKNIMALYKPFVNMGLDTMKQQYRFLPDAMAESNRTKKAVIVLSSTMLIEWVEAMEKELPLLKTIRFDLRLDGERARLTHSLSGDAGSWTESVRAAHAGKANPEYARANAFPPETVLMIACPDGLGIQKTYFDMYAGAIAKMSPEHAELLPGLFSDIEGFGPGSVTGGMYMDGERLVGVNYLQLAEPAALMAWLPVALERGNELIEALLAAGGPEEPGMNGDLAVAVSFDPEAGRIDGKAFGKIAIDLAAGEKSPISNTVLILPGDGMATFVYGAVGEADLAAAAKLLAAPGGLMEDAGVEEVVSAVENTQALLVVSRPLSMLAGMALNQSIQANRGNVEQVRGAAAKIEGGKGCAAIGVGANENAVTMEVVVSAGAVADFIRNADALKQLMTAVQPGPLAKGGATGGF